MANYAILKAAIQQVVKTNGNNEITGALLQQSLLAMINSLGADFQFRGVAKISTNPGTPDENVAYICGPGTYPNFNSSIVPDGNLGILLYNGSWTVSLVPCVTPNPGVNLVPPTLLANTILSNTGTLITLSTYANYVTTPDYIKINPNTTYSNSYEGGRIAKWAFYDSDFNFISVEVNAASFISPSNAHYVRISYTAANGYFMLAESNTPLPYEEYNPVGGYITNIENGIVEMRESIDKIMAIAEFTDNVQTSISPVANSYVNYDTGAIVTGAGTGPGFRRFDIPKNIFGGNHYIRAFSGANGTVPAAIAFYSGTPSAATYIKDASVQMSEPLNGHWYDAPIPDNAEYIVVTVGTTYATPNIQLIKIPAIPEIPDYSYLDSVVTVDNVSDADVVTNSYVNYNTGMLASAGVTSYLQRYTFLVPVGASSVRAFVAASDTVPAAIAFYSGTPSAATYIKDASVQMSEPLNGHWYDAPIPEDAEYIVVSNKFTVVEQAKIQVIFVPLYNNNRDQIARKPNFAESPFSGKPYYSHFNPIGLMVDGFGRKLIGGESLDDIRVAARLGFDFIEANLHETSDGVVIVTHGSNGFGPAFIDLTTGLRPTQQINNVTYDYILQNIRYDSALDKYKTPPPTIEQFLRCAKDNGLGVLLGITGLGEIANSVLQLAKRYLNDRIILYGTGIFRRPSGYNGYCFNWFNSSSDTIDSIKGAVQVMESPAICSLGPTTLANLNTAGKTAELIEWLHNNGYLFAIAYMSENENMEYLSMGCDLIASGYQVNQFNGNDLVVDINDITPNMTIVDGTLENGVISLDSGGTITIGDDTKIALGKGMLKIRFNGSIDVNFGSVGTRQITSTGNNDVIITDYFLIRKKQIMITANANTTIYNLTYQTSKC